VDVVGLGQISLDCVAALPRWPRAGEKLALAAPAVVQPGGQIATAVLAAVRLGLSGRLLGAVGADAAAETALAPLCTAGVDVSRVERVADAATRSAVVLVDADGERTVFGYRDPRLALRTADLSREAIREARALLVDAEDPDAARWAIDAARAAGVASVLDVERADPDPLELAMSVDFPIVSESFCADSSDSHRVSDEAERAWLTRLAGGRARMAVVTRGARGALACCGGENLEQPAFAVDAIDTTGAGDVFRGAFVWALLRGASAQRALALAACAAALACRGHGAQGALPTAAEVEARTGRVGRSRAD
jgi:sugar/nucleoside kinase (ribokinase family)